MKKEVIYFAAMLLAIVFSGLFNEVYDLRKQPLCE